MRYVLVDGTHGASRAHDFASPAHPFRAVMDAHGVEAFPFSWTTSLDGLWGRNTQWEVEGIHLYRTAVPYLCPESAIPSHQLVVIAFSHGAQVALHAFASGLKGRLITVNPPVRADMRTTIARARANIHTWVNLYGNWRDVWAVLGALGDGHLCLRRQFPEADHNILVAGAHGAALRDARYFHQWPGWFTTVMA